MNTNIVEMIKEILQAAQELQQFVDSPIGQELIAELEALLSKTKAVNLKLQAKK